MREIKFRGRSLVNNKYHSIKVGSWVYGSYIESGCDAPCIVFGDGEQCEIDRKTLGQLTGINDKNGAEIYEGDVIDWIFQDGNIAAIIEWDDHRAHFFFKPLDHKFGNHHEFHKLTKMEAIGNIHENPELAAA